MLTVHILASGSEGNSLLVSGEGTHVLLDAGISARRITAALRELGLSPRDLSGVLLTHEHSDHVSGLATLVKQYRPPLYATVGTARSGVLFSRLRCASTNCRVPEAARRCARKAASLLDRCPQAPRMRCLR